MPTSVRYVFTGKTPWPFLAVGYTALANFLAVWVLGGWCYTLVPDAVHSFVIRYRGGVLRYYRPRVGLYVEYGFWGHFVLLALAGFVVWCYRDQVRRVDPPPPRPGSGGDFLIALALSPILLSAWGGFAAGILWREGAPGWAAASALPFFALSILGVEHARSKLPDPRHPPLSPWRSRGLALLLSAATIAGIAFWMNG